MDIPPQARLGDNGMTYASSMAEFSAFRAGVTLASSPHNIMIIDFINQDNQSPLAAVEISLRISEDSGPNIALTVIPRDYGALKGMMERVGLLRTAGKPASERFVACKNGVWVDQPLPLRLNPNRPEDHAEFICRNAKVAACLLENSIVTFNSPDYFDAEKGCFVVSFEDQLHRMESKLKLLGDEVGFDNPDLAKFIAALKTNGLAKCISELGFANAHIANQPLIATSSRNK